MRDSINKYSVMIQEEKIKSVLKKTEEKVVLVVGNDIEILSLISHILELEGYKVLNAENFNEGYEILEKIPVDLVILDIGLLVSANIELLDKMENNTKLSEIPVVAIMYQEESAKIKRPSLTLLDDNIKSIITQDVLDNIIYSLKQSGKSKVLSQINRN